MKLILLLCVILLVLIGLTCSSIITKALSKNSAPKSAAIVPMTMDASGLKIEDIYSAILGLHASQPSSAYETTPHDTPAEAEKQPRRKHSASLSFNTSLIIPLPAITP